MKNNIATAPSRRVLRMGARVLQAMALASIIVLALPAHAADDRAVQQRVSPIYPQIAKRMGIGGEVKVEARVDASGKVLDAKAISGNHALSIAAEDAVRRWRFEPGSGESVVNVAISFNPGN